MTTIPHVKVIVPVYNQEIWDRSLARACYTTMSNVAWQFNHSLAVNICTIIEEGRNAGVTGDTKEDCDATYRILDKKYSHFLFLDSDIGFTGTMVNKLLMHDVDIVSGAYRPKNDPYHFVAGWLDSNGRITRRATPNEGPDDNHNLIRVDWAGGGFMLVKREALEKCRYPWFWKSVVYLSNRSMCIGEDVFACMNAKESGFQVWLDRSVILNHEGNRHTK